MSVVRLVLHGPIEDAFIYRSMLLCWTYSRELLRLPIGTIESALSRDYGELGDACSYLMFHSNGKGADRSQIRAWSQFRDELEMSNGTHSLHLDASSLEHDHELLKVEADDVLDMMAYFNRLYIATDGGLYSTHVDRSRSESESYPDHRMSIPTYGVTVSYGTVAASCGDDGLHVIYDDFGWAGVSNRQPERISDYSLHVEYASGRLFNYLTRSDIELFRGEITRHARGESSTGWSVLTSMASSRSEQQSLMSAFSHDSSSYDMVASSSGSIMMFIAGEAWSRTLRTHSDRLVVQGPLRPLGRYVGRPVAVAPVADRLAVETTEDLFIISPDTEFEAGECLGVGIGSIVSMRGFPRSRRYRNVAVASNGVGLNLVAIAPRTRRHRLLGKRVSQRG